ncbi:MAG: glycosyltransferase family 2 protein [Burkholderiales bacterium]|nr:glycosyltransferase family 2 protein [Burkholderiales bacterium]
MMRASVVIRSKDEADRLRLTLASLARQTVRPEVVVVDDGSSDATGAVIAAAAREMPVVALRHPVARGRAAASNAGARVASGDLLIFLDGDTLASPDMVERHVAAHAAQPTARLFGRGGRFHFRGTRFLLDPETCTPRPGEEANVARWSAAERARNGVTQAQIREDFTALAARASLGIYPGAGPQMLERIELDALRHHPECEVLWAAACGANFSVRRDAFVAAGGLHDDIDNNEHRAFALRMVRHGARMVAVEDARAFHMTHRRGWRDPLQNTTWERVFYAKYPEPAVKLLSVFWSCLDANVDIPAAARIESLPALAAAARGERDVDYDAIRRGLGLPDLGVDPGSAHGAASSQAARR